MTELQRYLAEEIAEEHAEGIITRREAFRRLGLLGLSAGAAGAILAGFTARDARGSASSKSAGASSHGAESVEWAPVSTDAITFPGPGGRTLKGAWAPAERARGGVLVIHENRGLNDHIRAVAGRLAAVGYAALAIDLLSEEGGSDAFTDPAEASAALGRVPEERFVADMKAGLSEIERRLPRKRLAAIGFCFGGGMVWQLLASGEPRLAAAAPFYGPFPENGDLSGSEAAVLAIYGGLDARVNATRSAAGAGLKAADLEHQLVTFEGADHAFFNDTSPRFNPGAAAEAYRRVVVWYGRFVAGHR